MPPQPDSPTEQLPAAPPAPATPGPHRPQLGWLWISLAVVAAIAIIGGVAGALTANPPSATPTAGASRASASPTSVPAGSIVVPRLIGLTGEEASRALGAAGVRDVRFAQNYAAMTQPVVLQSPVAGTRQLPVDPVFVTLQPSLAPQTAAPAAPTATAAPVSSASFSDGMYEVGTDIAPGKYKTTGQGSIGLCAWASYTDSSRDFEKLVDGANSTGQMYLTVRNGHFLEVAGGCTWTKQG